MVSNSTLSGNSADQFGGGIENGGTLTVSNSTLSGNSAYIFGGGIDIEFGTLTVNNSIVARNTGGDLSGSVSSGSHNLIGGNPLLGSLQNNGGPTPTMALLSGSPAIDAGDNTEALDTDQRGFARMVGGAIDIGAFEVQPAGQATHLRVQAPATVMAGTAFTISVTALDDSGHAVVGYTGTVHVMASNGAMANYTFTADDMGTHAFAGLVLTRAGPLTVSGTDTADAPITGSTTFTVTPAAADHIAFTVPSTIPAGVPFAITVTVQDAYGNTVTGYTGTVHFTASTGGVLVAMADYTFTPADSGQRTFPGLVLSQPGDYVLTGSDPDAGLGGSVAFTVDAV
jgi:hypothetical protein